MDFNTPLLSINPETISRMNGVLPENMPLMNFWKQNAQNYDLSKLAEFEAQRQAASQLRPFELEQKRLANEKTLADIAHTGAQTTGLGLANDTAAFEASIRNQHKDLIIQNHFKKLLSEGSAADRKHAENMIYENLRSSDPVKQEQAKKLLPTLEWYQKEEQKAVAELEKQKAADTAAMARTRVHESGATARSNAQIAAQKELEDARIKAGKYKSNTATKNFESTLETAKTAAQRHQLLIDGATVARQSGNEELAASYKARAEAIRPQAEAELRMLQKPGDIDLSKPRTPGQPLPTVPQSSIAPGGQKPDPLGIR